MQVYSQIRVWRAVSKYGAYYELTSFGNRPILQAGIDTYVYHDAVGEPTYWYKSTFFNEIGPVESMPSDPRNFGTWGILADALSRRLMSEGNNLSLGQLYDSIFDASCELVPLPAEITDMSDIELSWVVRRAVRHALAILTNEYIAKPNVTKGSVGVSLGSSAQQLMSRVKQLDEEWYQAKQNREFLIWNGRIQQVQDSDKTYTEMVEGGYRIDPLSGFDHTNYAQAVDAALDRVWRFG